MSAVYKVVRVTLDVVVQVTGDVAPNLAPWGEFSEAERAAQVAASLAASEVAASEFVADDCFQLMNFDIFGSSKKTDYGRIMRTSSTPVSAQIVGPNP